MKIGKALLALSALAAFTLVGNGMSAASASTVEPSVQKAIDQQIKTYGGKQISPYEVAYDNGNAIVVFPDASGRVPTSASARAEAKGATSGLRSWHGCPSGRSGHWYCFYQFSKWRGRMLQFKDCSRTGTAQSLATYGFSHRTSSWTNTAGNKYIDVWQGSNYLWTETPSSASSYVGKSADNRAEWFEAFC